MRTEKELCESCSGTGCFISFNTEKGYNEIQRCDLCKRFRGDVEAWVSLNPRPELFKVVEQ